MHEQVTALHVCCVVVGALSGVLLVRERCSQNSPSSSMKEPPPPPPPPPPSSLQ